MKTFLTACIILVSFLISTTATGEEQKYLEYTVKKGDTLWDITGGKLTDPFLWPKVWKENPGIKNPDLIYPGQRLRIPLYILQRQVEVRPVAEAPAERRISIEPKHPYVVKAALIAASGYIDREVPRVGRVAATPTGRRLIGWNDVAYIKLSGDGGAEKGKRFYTVRSLGEIRHPRTGESLGYLIEITGVIETVGEEAGFVKAKVVKSFTEIHTGDPIDHYYPVEPLPLIGAESPEINGTVVTARDLRVLNGIYDIVYIDRGSADGVAPGNLFDLIAGEKPNRPIGRIQVISTRQRTATAMVIKSEVEVMRGDYF